MSFPRTEPDLMGKTVGGLRLEKTLYREGAEVAYLGRAHKGDAAVVVTMLRHSDDELTVRFLEKTKTLVALAHDNLPRFLTCGDHKAKRFIVSEHVPGKNLKELVKDSGPMPIEQAFGFGQCLIEALCALHDAGLVHGGIRPSAAIDAGEGRLVLMPPVLPSPASADKLITGGSLRGINFIPPEQVMARTDPSVLSIQSDIYSVGAVLYFILTGTRPFDSPSPAITRRKVLKEALVPAQKLREEISEEAWSILLKAMAKLPEQRYQKARDMGDDITRLLRGETPRAHTEPKPLESPDLAPDPTPSSGMNPEPQEGQAERAKKARQAISRLIPAFNLDDEEEEKPKGPPPKPTPLNVWLILLGVMGVTAVAILAWVFLRS